MPISLRRIERVPAGARFELDMVFKVFDWNGDGGQTDLDCLNRVLEGLKLLERDALGGSGSRGYGRVVNVASVHGLVASKDKAPYVASKFGIVGLSKVAALEYAAQGSRDSGGITVNCICPGWVETPLIEPQIEARMQGGSRDDGVRALLAEKQPSLRMTLPAEIAALAVFLCRREAHNITGAALPVDGGWTAQ